jgi:hypothetical protein
LERRETPVQAIETYISQLGDLSRYNNAFKALWGVFTENGIEPLGASQEQVAQMLLVLNNKSEAQARHAYSACLLIPGLEQLRFSPLLKKCKQSWNSSTEKYATFWDAKLVLEKLVDEHLDWSSIKEVRNRLIICWRLLALHRSIDLARMQRKISFVGNRPFVLLRRKGWKDPKWEEVLSLPDHAISPWHLLQHYVSLTAAQVNQSNKSRAIKGPRSKSFNEKDSWDNLVLRKLCFPFCALSADAIGSITKSLLDRYGLGGCGAPTPRGVPGSQCTKHWASLRKKCVKSGSGKIPRPSQTTTSGWGPPPGLAPPFPHGCTESHRDLERSPTGLGLRRGNPNQEEVTGRAERKRQVRPHLLRRRCDVV